MPIDKFVEIALTFKQRLQALHFAQFRADEVRKAASEFGDRRKRKLRHAGVAAVGRIRAALRDEKLGVFRNDDFVVF